MTKKEREELCKLSEESFGTKYAWLGYLRTPKMALKDLPTNKTNVMRKVKVAEWRTLEEVKEMMTGKSNETEIVPKS